MKIIIQISLSLLLGLPAVLGRRQSSLDWRTRGRVEVARCRAASCLPTTSSSSSQESCWSLCDSPASQWFSPSNRVEELTRSSRSGQVWELSQSLTVTGCEVRWGQLEISRNSYRTLTTTSSRDQMDGSVGLLLGRDISGELSQTERRGVRLQPGLASNITALRLLMVGQEGVRLSQERELDSQTCGYSQLLTPVLAESHSEGDLLVRLSLSLGETPQSAQSDYLVRYQELPLHSSILGSLVVSSQEFDLTLVRDSSYVIQVENIDTGAISPPVIFHTSQETAGPTLTIILVTVLSTSFILLTALSFMLYLRSRRQPGQTKEELNNNNQICHHVILPPPTAPLHLDYNNIC